VGTRTYYDGGRPTSVEGRQVQSISFCSVLFIIFLVLKLCKVITWSWVWVFAPLWIPVALALAIAIVFFVCGDNHGA
jgi:energy-coupling factor transporter transmembrane protein EcfT